MHRDPRRGGHKKKRRHLRKPLPASVSAYVHASAPAAPGRALDLRAPAGRAAAALPPWRPHALLSFFANANVSAHSPHPPRGARVPRAGARRPSVRGDQPPADVPPPRERSVLLSVLLPLGKSVYAHLRLAPVPAAVVLLTPEKLMQRQQMQGEDDSTDSTDDADAETELSLSLLSVSGDDELAAPAATARAMALAPLRGRGVYSRWWVPFFFSSSLPYLLSLSLPLSHLLFSLSPPPSSIFSLNNVQGFRS